MSIIVVRRAMRRRCSPFRKKSEGPGYKPYVAGPLGIEAISHAPRYWTIGHLAVDDLRARKIPGNARHCEQRVSGYTLGLSGVRLKLGHQVSIQIDLLVDNVEHPFAGPVPRG